jgi:hypothetical protein
MELDIVAQKERIYAMAQAQVDAQQDLLIDQPDDEV